MVNLCFWFLVYAHGKVLYFWHEDATNERIMNREHIKQNITNVIFRNEMIRLTEDIKKIQYFKFAFDELCIEIRRNIESTNSIMQSLNVFTNYIIDMQKLERRSIDDRRPLYLRTLTRIKEEFYNPSNMHTLTAANIKPFTEYRMSESLLAFILVIIDDMIVSKIIEPYDIDNEVVCNANNLQYLYNQQGNFEATAAVIMNELAKNSVVDDHYLPLSRFMLDSKACTMKNIQKFFLEHICGFFSAGDILVFEKYDIKIITRLLGVAYPAYKSDELDCLADDKFLNIVAKFVDAEVSDLVTYIKSLIHTFTTANLMLYNCKETLFRQFHDLHQSKTQQYNLKKFQGYVRNIEGIRKLFDALIIREISQSNLDTSKVKQEASIKQ